MTRTEREAFVEAVAGSWRPRGDGRTLAHPIWHDLPEDARVEAAHLAEEVRRMEAALDPDGLSTTSRQVLDRIRETRRA